MDDVWTTAKVAIDMSGMMDGNIVYMESYYNEELSKWLNVDKSNMPPTYTLSNKVYMVKLKDGTIDYLIAEREPVRTNLIAHIRNNLLNETFGICENRYKATPKQKEQIRARKEEVLSAIRECETLEDILRCEAAKPYISAAWLDTPEAMIVRKMRNNAIKKFPKNLNSMASSSLLQLDETYKTAQEEVRESENSQEFAVEDESVVAESEAVEVETPDFAKE